MMVAGELYVFVRLSKHAPRILCRHMSNGSTVGTVGTIRTAHCVCWGGERAVWERAGGLWTLYRLWSISGPYVAMDLG